MKKPVSRNGGASGKRPVIARCVIRSGVDHGLDRDVIRLEPAGLSRAVGQVLLEQHVLRSLLGEIVPQLAEGAGVGDGKGVPAPRCAARLEHRGVADLVAEPLHRGAIA